MLDLLNRPETENDIVDHSTSDHRQDSDQSTSNRASKQAAIERELRENPNRSDSEIGRVVNVDHKTVGSARKRLSISPPGISPPTPTQRRQMLINACEDYDRSNPPGPSDTASAEEAVDNAIADGKVSLAPPNDDESDWCWSIDRQREIRCTAGPGGNVTIWQEGPEDLGDQTIEVSAGNAVQLARHILWAAGFKRVGIYTYVKGGGCEDLEDGYLASSYRRDE